MATGQNNERTERSGDEISVAAGPSCTPFTQPKPTDDIEPVANDVRLQTGLLYNKYLIFGLTGLAITILATVLFLLPEPDVGGRVLCVFGIALSYWVGHEWHKNGVAIQSASGRSTSPDMLQAIDYRMEQLEDAKWQLGDRAAHYRDLLDQHHDMIVRRNSAGRLTFANRAFCRKFDVELDAALGQSIVQDAIERVELPLSAEQDAEADATQRHYRDLMETIDGQRWIEWEAHQIGTGDNFEVQYTGRDVTDAVQAHQALEEARDQAQIANRSKSRFLASMSHEIRTPMNGILGMAKLLEKEPLSAQQKTYVNAIDLSARNLLTIIDEILDFSKVEAGKVSLSERYFSIEDTVLSVVELIAPKAQEKGLEIAWTVDSSARGEFVGDAVRVRQILLNLVSNAVKFTDHGGIRVYVSSKKDESQRDGEPVSHIKICVSDTGIGLCKSDQKALFSEFAQTDQAVKRQLGGTGLGLAISKRLAEAMGGGLSVESNVGKGSTFIARIKLSPILGAFASHNFATLHNSMNLKVLLAFDRLIERAALAEVLSDAGIVVVECTIDEVGSIARTAAQNGHPFTRIIVDAECDREIASRALQDVVEAGSSHGIKARDVRGLVLVNIFSRNALPEFQSCGYDAYLVRPVRPKTLFEQLITERMPVPEVDDKATRNSTEKLQTVPQRKLHFLLVEDNDINAMLVDHQLKHLGHSITRVGDGLAAVEAINEVVAGHSASFDVILMDVLLPEMDGLEATAKITQLYEDAGALEQKPPVIALTANAFEEDKQRCLEAGMDDYLAKPFDQEMLTTALSRCNLC